MSKAVKRARKINIDDVPRNKLPKLIDFTNITKDISVLQTFFDLIDDSDGKVIDDYLNNNDIIDFLNYFNAHHLYKNDQFCLIFKVCTEILMRIAGETNSKHSLAGQSFAETFMNQYKSLIYLYLKNNKSNARIITCLKFITALILQSKDLALKVATELDFVQANFIKLLSIRKLRDDEDVHTCVLNCYASFFIMGSNYLIRKVCEETALVGAILKDLRFERFQNVQLMIEILHDKIIKNGSVSKTTKMKFFNVSSLRFLLAVYQWKGATNSYDSFKNLSTVDEDCGEVHSQLHSLLVDLCSSHQIGIAFVDNLLCQSQLGNSNKRLLYLITSDAMQDFISHPLKQELLTAILTACPDLVNPFVEHLVKIMSARQVETWNEIFQHIVQCYRLLSTKKINNILTEALNYNKGEKFIDIALIMCIPTKSLLDLLQTNEEIRVNCADCIRDLRNALIDTCEKVITWMNVSDVFYSQHQRSQMKSNLEDALIENYSKCSWEFELKILLSEELNDGTIFTEGQNEMEIGTEETDEDEAIDPEISDSFTKLKEFNEGKAHADVNGDELLKQCYQHFISKPFNVSLLKLIGATLINGKCSLKKKHKRLLVEFLTDKEFLSEHLSLLLQQDELYAKSEQKRNSILDIIIHCISGSKALKATFFECVHPLRLLSFYGASLSHSDQKLLFLIMLQKISGIECSDYSYILFGNAVSEHYTLENNKSPVLNRPLITAQCFNLLEDDKFVSTINHFPITRLSPVGDNQELVLVASQPSIYDPYFVLQWICQILNIDKEKGLKLEFGIDMKTLFSKHIISFLVACQSSELRHVRVVSKCTLKYFLAILETMEGNIDDFPMRYPVQMILFHFFLSLSETEDFVKVSSIFTNFYVKILRLVAFPGKKLFEPLINIINHNQKLDLRYVPSFQQLVYSKDNDAKLRQSWCFGLISESVKCYEDFRIVLDSKVFSHIFCCYENCEQNIKRIILSLLRNCVSIEKVAGILYNYPQFIMWLNFVANNKKDKSNRDMVITVIEKFILSLKKLENEKLNIEELENNFKLYLPEINFES